MSAPACWAWRRCPGNYADRCAAKHEACTSSRRPKFGDVHEPRPFTKEEREAADSTARNNCANFRRHPGNAQ